MPLSHAERQRRYRDRLRLSRDGETAIILEILTELRALRDLVTQSHVTSPTPPSIKTLPSEEESYKKKKERNAHADAFAAFWRVWPHKVDRKKAVPALAKALQTTPLEIILAGVARYVATKPVDRPWLNPTTFLNGARWNDEPDTKPNGYDVSVTRTLSEAEAENLRRRLEEELLERQPH